MCGIAGILSDRNNGELNSIIKSMLQVQKHRGPDYLKFERFSDKIAFGHNRLSIIDLSEFANQPFRSQCQRYSIIFNGEIFNYRELRNKLLSEYTFRTNSDTEVLLNAYIKWGENVLDKLNGMFAFAIYDHVDCKIFAARDRFGVKPFYYYKKMGLFVFASEIKTLFASGIEKTPNNKMWASYLTQGIYSWQQDTFWEGIKELPAGHFIEVDAKHNIKIQSWYDFVDRIVTLKEDSEYNSFTSEEHLRNYEDILVDSVKLRFRSDVPVGFNVSGGLDSSTLLGVIHNLFPKRNVQAYSFYCDDERYDELPWVKQLMNLTGRDFNRVLLSLNEVPVLAEKMADSQDEPYGGIPTLAYSKIFKLARSQGCIVLLDGQGMDESWAGYDYYHNRVGGIVQGTTSSPFCTEVLLNEFKGDAYKVDYPKPFKNSLLNLQYRDLFFTKIPRALRFNDRASMVHSTELREPFLDYRLVEYAFALPDDMKIQNMRPKWALRKLSESYLSSAITTAPKRPLQTPQREWLATGLKDFVGDNLLKLEHYSFIKWNELLKHWDLFLKGRVDNSFYIWQWISLAQFMK